MSHRQAQGSGWERKSALTRSSARGISSKPYFEHVGDMGHILVPLSSSTLILKGLLIRLLTRLESALLSASTVPSALSIAPPSMLKSSYGVPPSLSMDPLVVCTSTFSTLKILSVILLQCLYLSMVFCD